MKMGDRICLTFISTEDVLGAGEVDERSPVLYAHWDGRDLIDNAKAFWNAYHDKIRSEPSNWMVNFLVWLRQGEIADGNYYLYPDAKSAASPDDNGFWEFNTQTGEYRQTEKGDYQTW